jgi:sugar lactone lactonase YvrE
MKAPIRTGRKGKPVFTRRARTLSIVALSAIAVTLVAAPAEAAAPVAPARAASHRAPTTFPLPDGFQPEGIAIGKRPYAYFGSRADGSIYRADLRTGRGRIISTGPGTPSLGLKIDGRGRLFVAGGSGGDARVIDARSGRVLRSYPLQTVPAFINDVILTRDAAWFTDSTNPVLFKLPLRHGKLPTRAVRVPLTGDIAYTTGNNANGIATTPNGRGLLIVQSNTGKLFRVSTAGRTTEVDLGGASLTNGDGLLRSGRTLYVVQNRLNTVTKLRLNAVATRAVVVGKVTDARFDVPTTIAAYGRRLYLPNARFTTPPTPQTTYDVVAIRRF